MVPTRFLLEVSCACLLNLIRSISRPNISCLHVSAGLHYHLTEEQVIELLQGKRFIDMAHFRFVVVVANK